jgi:uncharacterized protein DUF6456
MAYESGLQTFVRGLIAGETARLRNEHYSLADGRSAPAEIVADLINEGVLSGGELYCHANPESRAWLKRSLLDAGAFAAQHRILRTQPNGAVVNIAESPLARLGQGASAYLEPHHLEAGEKVRRLVERAELQPRLTMRYSAARTATASPYKNDISDLAADARRALADIHKGLQEVERERGWPRRSAKLVLRIGLQQLAQHFGIGPVATGRRHARSQQWMDSGARPSQLG